MTLPDVSHPIRLGLRLLPRTHAAVGEVVVATSDGLLDGSIHPVAVVDY